MIWTEMIQEMYDGQKKQWVKEIIHYAGNHMDPDPSDTRFTKVPGVRKRVIPVGLANLTVEQLLGNPPEGPRTSF